MNTGTSLQFAKKTPFQRWSSPSCMTGLTPGVTCRSGANVEQPPTTHLDEILEDGSIKYYSTFILKHFNMKVHKMVHKMVSYYWIRLFCIIACTDAKTVRNGWHILHGPTLTCPFLPLPPEQGEGEGKERRWFPVQIKNSVFIYSIMKHPALEKFNFNIQLEHPTREWVSIYVYFKFITEITQKACFNKATHSSLESKLSRGYLPHTRWMPSDDYHHDKCAFKKTCCKHSDAHQQYRRGRKRIANM